MQNFKSSTTMVIELRFFHDEEDEDEDAVQPVRPHSLCTCRRISVTHMYIQYMYMYQICLFFPCVRVRWEGLGTKLPDLHTIVVLNSYCIFLS